MRVLLALSILLIVPSAAAADTVTRDGDTSLTLIAGGQGSAVDTSNFATQSRLASTGGVGTPPAGCTGDPGDPNAVLCPMTRLFVIDFAAGGTNEVHHGASSSQTQVKGGPGPDKVISESSSKATFAGAGGDDILLDMRAGPSAFTGGPGADTVSYAARTAAVTVVLDDVADDGETREMDRVDPDVETVIGGSGPDRLAGGPGANTLTGGAGDDELSAKDGGVDTLSCGDGNDLVHVDADDVVADDCERQDVAPPTTAAAPTRVLLKKPSLGVLGRRGLSVSLTCAKACTATGRLKTGTRPLGRVAFDLASSGTVTKRLRLSTTGRRRIKGEQTVKVTFVFTVTLSGGAPARLKRRLTLRR